MTNQRNPTLLRTPTWLQGMDNEIPLVLPAEEYEIIPKGDRVQVVERGSRKVIYEGIGPAEVLTSPAPF